MVAAAFGYIPPPPPIWADPRSRTEIFEHPLSVEVQQGGAFVLSVAALAAISKPWQPGKQDDRSSVGGVVRLSLPRSGLFVFVGRGRGRLDDLTIDGAVTNARWLGLDSVPTGSPLAPRGWHPFVLTATCSASSVWDLKRLKLSALSGRFAG